MTKNQRQRVLEKFGGRCAYCGERLTLQKMQVDHLKPIFRTWDDETVKRNGCDRGADNFENWMPACRPCNKRKGALNLEEFRYELEQTHSRLFHTNANYRQLFRFGISIRVKQHVKFYFEGLQNERQTSE